MTFLHSEIGQRMKKAFEADSYTENSHCTCTEYEKYEKDWNG